MNTKRLVDWKVRKQKWKAKIKSSKYRGLPALAEEMGVSAGTLRSTLSNSSAPSAEFVLQLCAALGETPNTLLDINDPRYSEVFNEVESELRRFAIERLAASRPRISSSDIMKWWHQTGGLLTDHCRFEQTIDLYSMPDLTTGQIVPLSMGAHSLASVNLGASSPDLLRKTIEPLGRGFQEKILLAHKSSIEKGPVSTVDHLDAERVDGTGKIQITYIVTRLPATLNGGRKGIITHAELLDDPPLVAAP